MFIFCLLNVIWEVFLQSTTLQAKSSLQGVIFSALSLQRVGKKEIVTL